MIKISLISGLTCEEWFLSRIVMVNKHWRLFCYKLKFNVRVNRAVRFNKYALEQLANQVFKNNNYLKL